MINLTAALEAGLSEKKNNWNEGKLHVSDLGVSEYIDIDDRKCPRQLWLRYWGAGREELNAGTRLMFDQGHALEERAVKLLRRGLPHDYKVIATQFDVSLGLPEGWAGRLDILLSDGSELMVIDVKTRRGNSFRYNDGIRPTEKFQVAGYLQALSLMMTKEVSKGAILEIDREGQNFAREHHFTFNQKLEKKISKTIENVQELVSNEEPPDMLPPKITRNENKGADSIKADLPWQCSYCSYRSVSCPGAIPPEFDDNLGKVVGHIEDGEFQEKVEGISKYVEGVI